MVYTVDLKSAGRKAMRVRLPPRPPNTQEGVELLTLYTYNYIMIDINSAGGIIFDKRGKLLIINTKSGFLGFPKGHLEEGETPEIAALREVKEETGIQRLGIVKDLGIVSRRRKHLDGSSSEEIKNIKLYLMIADLSNIKEGEEKYNWYTLDEAINKVKYQEEKVFLLEVKDKLSDILTNLFASA